MYCNVGSGLDEMFSKNLIPHFYYEAFFVKVVLQPQRAYHMSSNTLYTDKDILNYNHSNGRVSGLYSDFTRW